jgi:arylsulfatase A-like enzyme
MFSQGMKVFLPLSLLAALHLPLIGSAADHTPPTDREPLNIVLLYADDWRHDTLGVAGHPVVETPALDSLSQESIRFTNSYVTTSICDVSRASLLTGQWMSRHGGKDFERFKTPLEATFPSILRENGYHVGYVGKWHNGEFPAELFDYGTAYYGHHWFETDDGEQIHVTERNEEDALEFLRTRPDGKPFCLIVSFFAPHAEDAHPDQFLPQPESMTLYEGVSVPVPENATEDSWRRLPDFFDENNEGRNRWHWRFDEPEKYQRMMKNYYRLISEVDAVSGRILRELEKRDLLDQTLVIFTTDNGYFHGEHGLADKWYPYEESIRVPLILRDPRVENGQRGSLVEAITLNVDLAPTILAAAGLEAPEGMQGRNLTPLYSADKNPAWREDFFYEHPTILNPSFIPASQALVRKDWKYIYWPEHNVEQLFDLSNDPREENDLASSPHDTQKLREMRQRFETLKAEAR